MALCSVVRARALYKLVCPALKQKVNIKNGVRLLATKTFKASDVQISVSEKRSSFNVEKEKLIFGKTFSDHMLEIQWDGDNWEKPVISPFHNLELHPAAKSLHYAVQLFEGMKAFRGDDDIIRLFRPEENMKRMNATAERGALPTFDGNELLTLIKKLIQIDERWVPRVPESSLYIRPTLISNEKELKVEQPKNCLLFVILSPTGPYFDSGFKPISLLADPKYVRAWPGGVGGYKLGANYGPTLAIQKVAMGKKFHQVCWLYGPERYITEIGAMNIFMFLKNSKGEKELVTPPLDGLILPGIVRLSVLEMTRAWNEFKVSERRITMDEVVQASKEGRLLESFSCGTAAVICPIGEIQYEDHLIKIPTIEQEKPVFKRLYDSILDIQYGRVKHPWAIPI